MNAAAYFIATQRMEALLRQSANERLISSLPKRTLRARIATAVRRIVRSPIDLSGPTLPSLENYPYRG